MGRIAEKIHQIRKEIEKFNCSLVAISKTKPNELIMEAYEAGQRDFGENKVQELAAKFEQLPKDIHWHMVGHLQRNKVKLLAPFVHLIHSVDSIRLLKEINKEAAKCNRVIPVLLQVHIARETTKFGFDEAELETFLTSRGPEEYPHICIKGLMGMATLTEDAGQIRREFTGLKQLFDRLGQTYSFDNCKLTELSMGMSDDYPMALECGSTMIRVGSSVFGQRNEG